MKHWTLTLALAASLAGAPAALATPLAPDSSVDSIEIFGLAPDWVTIADTGYQTVSADTFTVRLRTTVLRDTATGFLDFLYSVENLQQEAQTNGVEQLQVQSYANGTFTDVFAEDSSVLPALGAVREADGLLRFLYGPNDQITPGNYASVLVRTHDTHYQAGTLGAADGAGNLAFAASFVSTPSPSVVPLPGSLMLGLSGLVTLAGGLFRRFRRGLTPAL